jgi:hypothetical protein
MTIEFSLEIVEKSRNVKFNENSMKIYWKFNESLMKIQWKFNQNAMKI